VPKKSYAPKDEASKEEGDAMSYFFSQYAARKKMIIYSIS